MKKITKLKKTNTIKDSLKLLKGQFGMIICIVEKNDILIGVVTDGDLRRAILDGNSLDTKIEKIMNKSPIYIFENELKNKKIIKSNLNLGTMMDRPLIIPVLNKKGKLLYLLKTEDLFEILQKKNKKKYLSQIKKPHILVVGGAGYIGSVLTSLLLKKGWRVKIVDKLLYEKKSLDQFKNNKNLSLINKDICDLSVQIEAIKDIDCVVFLAEIVGDPSCAAKPEDALKTNYLAVSSLANLCSYMSINRFVYTSSCSVYGANNLTDGFLDEESPLNPVSHYARIKLMSEKILLSQSNYFFSPTILRLATVCGTSFRNRFDLVVNTFARNAFFSGKITINGGSQWRPNIHVEDVAKGIIKVIEAPIAKVENQVFNLCNDSQNFVINDLGNKVKSIFPKCKIIKSNKNFDKRDYKVVSSKIKKILNFEASKTVEEVLLEFKELFKKKKFNPYKKKYSNIETLTHEI
tara:strand:- start:1091 stop:2479 length:1389 start_codon:yes stop_codon:yes gene_type:complete